MDRVHVILPLGEDEDRRRSLPETLQNVNHLGLGLDELYLLDEVFRRSGDSGDSPHLSDIHAGRPSSAHVDQDGLDQG